MSQQKKHYRKAIAVVAVGLFAVGAGWVLHNFEPNEQSWYPKCILHQLTGLHCPGCGTTRALRAVLNGDLRAAIGYNPMLIVGGPIIAAALWRQGRRQRAGAAASPTLAWALFIVLVLYCVGRNVPSPSTSPLAPPETIGNERWIDGEHAPRGE